MFRFRWIGQLFSHPKCSPPRNTRKVIKPTVQPKLESLENRELLSADPISQAVGAAAMPTIAHTASNTTDANNDVSPLTVGYVLNLAHAIESKLEATWQGYCSRMVAIADSLWSGLHGQSQDAIPTGPTQVGSGSGGGSGGNGVASKPLPLKTAAHGSGSGSGFAALDSGSGSSVYTWDPPAPKTDNKASNPVNWLLNGQRQNANGTVPGSKPTDAAVFDPGSPSITDGNGNADIVWGIHSRFEVAKS